MIKLLTRIAPVGRVLAVALEYGGKMGAIFSEVDQPHTVETMLDAAQASQPIEIRKEGLGGLVKLTLDEENNAKMYDYPRMMQTMLDAAQGDPIEIKLEGLRGLVNLSVAQENTPKMFDRPHVVEIMLDAAQASKSTEIRHLGLRGLVNLAVSKENRTRMLHHPRMMETMLDGAQANQQIKIQELALKGLANLASAGENMTKMCDYPRMVETMLDGAQASQPIEIRNAALLGLTNLTIVKENMTKMFDYPRMVETMLQAAQESQPIEIRELGVKGFSNLAVAEKNKSKMLDHPRIMETMLQAAQENQPIEIRELGVRGILNLAIAEENKSKMLDHPRIVETMLQAAQENQPIEIRELGVKGLLNLAVAEENQSKMLDHLRIVETMVDAAQVGQPIELQLLGLYGLASLASSTTALRLWDIPHLVDTMVKAVEQNDNGPICATGLRGLWSISDSPTVADMLVEKFDLLTLLVENQTDTEHIPNIFLNLAIAPKTRNLLSQDEQVLRRLQAFAINNEKRVSVVAKLTLAILKGSDPNFLQVDHTTLVTLGEILEGALDGKIVMGAIWPIVQPLLAFRYLVTIDANRASLGTKWLNLLPRAINLIQNKDIVEPVLCAESAFSCLLQYALDEKTAMTIKGDPKFIEISKKIVAQKQNDSVWTGAVNTARGLIFTLEGSNNEVVTTQTVKDQVMISYAWGPPPHKNQELAAYVETYLFQNGFKVWRDEGMMSANVMDAMANAVATSQVIIVLVTKTYMESANCKRELIFAIRHARKIIPLLAQPGYDYQKDGWLGVVLCDLLYYDISTPNNRTKSLQAMVSKELGVDHILAGTTKHQLVRGASTKLPSVKVPESEEELKAWASSCKITEDVVQAIIKEGYLGEEMLGDLASQSALDIKLLLGLDVSAKATKLQRELTKMFKH